MRSFHIEHDGRPVLAYNFILVTSQLCGWLLGSGERKRQVWEYLCILYPPLLWLLTSLTVSVSLEMFLLLGYSLFFCNVK